MRLFLFSGCMTAAMAAGAEPAPQEGSNSLPAPTTAFAQPRWVGAVSAPRTAHGTAVLGDVPEGEGAAPSAAALSAKEANQLFQQGRYSRAAQIYGALLQNDPDNPHLHYDLGNALYKEGTAGSLGRSTAEFWRAYRRLPRDPDIRYNLDFALKKTGESLVPQGMPETLHAAFYFLSSDELSGIQWIGYWLALLLGATYILGAGLRDRLRPWLISAVVFWAAGGGWRLLRQTTDIANPGVILESNAEARSGPGMNFPVSFNAPEGRRVAVLTERGDWLEIGMLKEGVKGWVSSKAVERL